MLELSLLLAVVALFKTKDYLSIFWLSYSSVLIIFCFSNEYGDYPITFSLFILVFSLVSFVSNLFLTFSTTSLPTYRNSNFTERSYGLLGFFVGGLSLFFYIVGAGGINGITKSWVDIAVERSTLELFLSNFSQLLYLLSLVLLLLSYDITKKFKFIFLMFIIAVLFLALSRAKAYLLPFLFSLVVIFLNNNKKYPIKVIIVGSLYSFFIVFFYLLTTFFRWIGGSEKWNVDNFKSVMQLVLDKGVERNLVEQATGIFSFYVENQKLWGQTYFSFYNPILKFFDLNIENPIYIYHQILHGQSHGMKGSAHPTIFTDAFANFSIFGVFLGLFWMIFLLVLYKLCLSQNRYGLMVYIVTTSYSIPLIFRGSVYYGFLYLILSVSFMLIIGCMIKPSRSVTKDFR